MSPANYIYLVVQHWHPKDIWTVKGEAFCPVMSFANVNDVNSYMYAYWRHAIEDYKKYMVRSYGPEELENLDFETSEEDGVSGARAFSDEYADSAGSDDSAGPNDSDNSSGSDC